MRLHGRERHADAGRKVPLFELVAQHAAPASCCCAAQAGERARDRVPDQQAAEMGYVAAMVRTPHYYKSLLTKPEAQLLYYRAVADQAKIPLMIYNWPQTTGLDIPADVVGAFRAPERHRHQGKLRQHREGDADDPRVQDGLPGAGGSAPHAGAFIRGRRGGRGAGLRECRSVFDDRNLGGAPPAGVRRRRRIGSAVSPARRFWSRPSTASRA